MVVPRWTVGLLLVVCACTRHVVPSDPHQPVVGIAAGARPVLALSLRSSGFGEESTDTRFVAYDDGEILSETSSPQGSAYQWSRMDPAALKRWLDSLRVSELFSLGGHYRDHGCHDCSTYTLFVASGGKTKRISAYGLVPVKHDPPFVPEAFQRVYDAIAGFKARSPRRWQSGSKDDSEPPGQDAWLEPAQRSR